jgi:hypothetical protein
MKALRVALGLIQNRGGTTLPPGLVAFGATESDFLARHVGKVRTLTEASARAIFRGSSYVATLLPTLLTSTDAEFTAAAQSLQDRLAKTMKATTSAADCVFALVTTGDSAPEHVTILKLDAVVEAARTSIEKGQVSLTVLKDLIPDPGRLQKALSWPDTRASSDVVMIDTNVTHAQYFENAFDVLISPRSQEAEETLQSEVIARVPIADLPQALEDAGKLDGPLDDVLEKLAKTYPTLSEVAVRTHTDPKPSGIIRPNKVAALPITFEADGAKLVVPPGMIGSVTIEKDPNGNGWRLIITSRTEPTIVP